MRTFSLGAGADVVKFTLATAGNENNITNFTVSGTNLDKLNFDKKAFTGLGTLSGSLTDVKQDTEADTSSSGVTTIYKGTLNNLETHLKGKASGDAGKVVVAVATDAGDDGGIYAVTLASNAAPSSVIKVGTLDGVDLDTLTMSNFAAA